MRPGSRVFAALEVVPGSSTTKRLVIAGAVLLTGFLAVQYSNTDLPGVVIGALIGLFGLYLLFDVAGHIDGWARFPAALHLAIGTLLLGGVTNGMMLGHWYLNQPGLKPWALARLTMLSLVACGASLALGLATVGALSSAETEGAALGIPGFGQDFGVFFYVDLGCSRGVHGSRRVDGAPLHPNQIHSECHGALLRRDPHCRRVGVRPPIPDAERVMMAGGMET